MTILIVDNNTQLGKSLAHYLNVRRQSYDVLSADPIAIQRIMMSTQYEIVVNTVSSEFAETATEAYALHRDFAAELAKLCRDQHLVLIHLSRAEVFSGRGEIEWHESQKAEPTGWCGQSMLEGEQAVVETNPQHVIIRTGVMFSEFLENPLTAIISESFDLEKNALYFSSPSYAGHVAEIVFGMIQQIGCRIDPPLWGVYHYNDADPCLFSDWARTAASTLREQGVCSPSLTMPQNLDRQERKYYVLNTEKALYHFGIRPRSWRRGLVDAVHRWVELQYKKNQ